MAKEIVILAPHPDDELIGCFEVIEQHEESGVVVLYPDVSVFPLWVSRGEKMTLPLKMHPVMGDECRQYLRKTEAYTYLFPDPVYEYHPSHRKWGAIGEQLLREGLDVFFYSVNMSAPYVRETKSANRKRNMLNMYYPENGDLWKYEHKYFLFEGQVRWVVDWNKVV